jgi:putative endonuclease
MVKLRDFFSQPHTRAKGRVGEDRAVAWLKGRGYRIVARNVTNAGGEIDVVARDGDTLCFVEIKARADAAFGGAVGAVDWKKRQRLERAARAFLAKHPWDGPCRFDVVGIDLSESPETGERGSSVTLLKNAFLAGE